MWISLLALLVAATPAAPTKAAPTKAAKSSKTRPQAVETGGAFGELPEPTLRLALGAMGEPVVLGAKEARAVEAVVAKLRTGDDKGARKAWTRAVELHHAAGGRGDVAALVGMVIREVYLSDVESLRQRAEKVAFYNELRRELRDELQATRDAMALAQAEGVDAFTVTTVLVRTEFKAGRKAVLTRERSSFSLAQAQVMLGKWEDQLASVGEDAQLANIDMQNALQKQQQTLQMLSNISKMLHDTAMTVICKMAGTC
ncbi:MAG: hypothetical protein KDK70_25510 [Myxococcales bacterium]|nr:hypothetical protein [Myxococcales bacterium]